jgi:hypothetical protein
LQFRRIAQIQAELDFVKHAWSRMKGQSKSSPSSPGAKRNNMF